MGSLLDMLSVPAGVKKVGHGATEIYKRVQAWGCVQLIRSAASGMYRLRAIWVLHRSVLRNCVNL